MAVHLFQIRQKAKFDLNQIKIVKMLSSCTNRQQSLRFDSNSQKGRKATAESEESNTEHQLKDSAQNSKELIEDWIEREMRIELEAKVEQSQKWQEPPRKHFKLPPSNYTNNWTLDFQIVYHQHPPTQRQGHILSNQNRTVESIQGEMSGNEEKSLDMEFSKIMIEDLPTKQYYSPVPYGFDAERSRIIVGDRALRPFFDCSFKEFVTQIASKKNEDGPFKGIKLTCSRHAGK